MAEPKLISALWSAEVQIFLKATPERVPTLDRGNVRLSKALRDAKPDPYIPQMVSLGPYHHFSLKDEPVGPFHLRLTHLSQMDMYKLMSARDVAGNDPRLIEDMFARVSHPAMISELEKFYDWDIKEEDAPNFAWMMMVDALFLSYFLKSGSDNAIPARASIRCDVVKLENQVPLSLLRMLEVIAKDLNTLDSLLPSISKCLSSFRISVNEDKAVKGKGEGVDEKKDDKGKTREGVDEEHLLGCIHKHVSSFLQVSDVEEELPPTRFQKVSNVMGDMVAAVLGLLIKHPPISGRQYRYNAKELLKFDIKCKSFTEPGKIRFCRNSHTLFLPQIIVSDTYTEVLLRNLLVLEFNDPKREKHVMKYAELMECLIDTPEDVALLRESHVINPQNRIISDDYVARMWYDISRPMCLGGFLELPGSLGPQIRDVLHKKYYDQLLDHYKSKIRGWWNEFHKNYLSSPWKLAALVGGVFVLLLTMVQTYCTLKDCHPENNKTERVGRKGFRRFG